MKNIVYNELLNEGYDIYIGKFDSKEVDFIATRIDEKIYIQVANLLADEKVIEREFGVFAKIKDNYSKYVISFDKWNFSRDGIIHKNIVYFLLEE